MTNAKSTRPIGRTIRGRLLAAERRANSRNGNPSWFIVVEVDGGDIIGGRTARDSAAGYEIAGMGRDVLCEFTYHVEPGGLVFTYVQRVRP